MAFNENLRIKRTALKISMQELAEQAGVSHEAIRKYEMGTIIPNAIVALNIARTLGTTVEALVDGEKTA